MALNKEQRRNQLYGLLRDLPDRSRRISATKIGEEERESYVLEKLVLDLNGIEPVPAYFIRPQARGPLPAILYNHAHGSKYVLGKDELVAGRDGLQKPPYAQALAQCGYAALCIDVWAFGERRGRSESEIFKEMLWTGRVMWGMMVYDSLRALDYLVSRPEVDPKRIATLGISMGSTMAWWLAALDKRVKVTIDICCLTDFHSLLRRKALSEHGLYYYVPSLLRYFTTAEINALIAPRPHLGIAGNLDSLTPPEGLDEIDRHLKKVYLESGYPERWQLLRYDVGHQETPQARVEILEFLNRFV